MKRRGPLSEPTQLKLVQSAPTDERNSGHYNQLGATELTWNLLPAST